jgi:hypothetical protein
VARHPGASLLLLLLLLLPKGKMWAVPPMALDEGPEVAHLPGSAT